MSPISVGRKRKAHPGVGEVCNYIAAVNDQHTRKKIRRDDDGGPPYMATIPTGTRRTRELPLTNIRAFCEPHNRHLEAHEINRLRGLQNAIDKAMTGTGESLNITTNIPKSIYLSAQQRRALRIAQEVMDRANFKMKKRNMHRGQLLSRILFHLLNVSTLVLHGIMLAGVFSPCRSCTLRTPWRRHFSQKPC